MRLFGLLGGGWSINFSQQDTEGDYEHLTRVRGVAPDSAGEGAEPRSGSVYRAIETAWIESTPGET